MVNDINKNLLDEITQAVAKKAPAKKAGVLDSVYGIITRSKKGVDVPTLRSKTGFESKQISNAIYKLSKRGQITTASRGIYVKK